MPLGFARVTPTDARAKLSICMIIWFTINVFIAMEEIGTERGAGAGRPSCAWLLCGPASLSVLLDADFIRKIYTWPKNVRFKRVGSNSPWEGRNRSRL